MAVNDEYLKTIKDQLSDFGEIQAKKTFAGIGFFHEGLMFGMIGKNVLHLKAVSQVWKAITEVDQMRQWFFENIEFFEAEIGFETQFNVKSQDKNFLHHWKLAEVIPEKKITYNWTYKNYPGNGFVTFELSGQNNKTSLRLTTTGMETFPQEIEEFSRESCIGGWNYFIKDRLKT